jgi:hypothetical protein
MNSIGILPTIIPLFGILSTVHASIEEECNFCLKNIKNNDLFATKHPAANIVENGYQTDKSNLDQSICRSCDKTILPYLEYSISYGKSVHRLAISQMGS